MSNQPLHNLAEPLALAAVGNDDEWSSVSPARAFQLGEQMERFRWQFRAWKGARQPSGRFVLPHANFDRVRAFVLEHECTCKIVASSDTGDVEIVVTRRRP